MKNLKQFGKLLSSKDQKEIFGGDGRPKLTHEGDPCYDRNENQPAPAGCYCEQDIDCLGSCQFHRCVA